MENISHTLAGLLAGELVHRALRPEADEPTQSLRRRVLLTTGALASNFPDLDLVLSPLLPAPLGYLLHHRGHTHTILYALPQAMLLTLLIFLLWPSARRLVKESRIAAKGFGIAVFVGFSLHLMMDYLNSYGIHPFHPFDSRWFYGDMVFIVEPLFWVTFGVPMAMTIKRKWLRVSMAILPIAFATAFTIFGFLPWFSLLTLMAIMAVLIWVQTKSGARGTSAFVISAFIGIAFVGLQSLGSGVAKKAVQDQLTKKNQNSLLIDAAMSSLPTNPLCWSFTSIETTTPFETADAYRIRRGVISLVPSLIPAHRCPEAFRSSESVIESNVQVLYFSESTHRLELLRNFFSRSCYFNSWMRFTRIPYVTETEAYDARFSATGRRANFSAIADMSDLNQSCDWLAPEWDHPRAELLLQKQVNQPTN